MHHLKKQIFPVWILEWGEKGEFCLNFVSKSFMTSKSLKEPTIYYRIEFSLVPDIISLLLNQLS